MTPVTSDRPDRSLCSHFDMEAFTGHMSHLPACNLVIKACWAVQVCTCTMFQKFNSWLPCRLQLVALAFPAVLLVC